MKKSLFIIVSFACILLVGCDSKVVKINPEDRSSNEGLGVQKTFNHQIEEAQYISDIEDFVSYKQQSISENKPFTSEISIKADLDKASSLKGGVGFSYNKYSKSNDHENSEISFDIDLKESADDPAPIKTSGALSLLYENDEMYANVHNFDLFMGDDNSSAKMYTLMAELLVDKRVDLEVKDGGIISIDTESDKKFPYIVSTLESVLKAEDIYDSPNFLNSVAELIDFVNSYIDLGISTDELTLFTGESSYSELSQGLIQKEFTGSFQGKQSAFDLSFIASKKGFEMRLYNVKEFDKSISNYIDRELEFSISIQENKKSEYDIDIETIRFGEKILEMEGKIKYSDDTKISASFVMEPQRFAVGEKLSGKVEGNIMHQSGVDDSKFPTISGDTLSINGILSSLGMF